MDITEGFYAVEEQGEEKEVEVYEHPIKGLCVWFEDYAPGGIDLPVSTNGDGHVPILCSGLEFLNKIEP